MSRDYADVLPKVADLIIAEKVASTQFLLKERLSEPTAEVASYAY
jgi:hypothetical protein